MRLFDNYFRVLVNFFSYNKSFWLKFTFLIIHFYKHEIAASHILIIGGPLLYIMEIAPLLLFRH